MKVRATYVLLLIGLGVLIALIATSPGILKGRAERESVLQTFDTYGNALVAGKFEEAYSYCGTEFQNAMPYAEFVQQQEEMQKQYGKLLSVLRKAYEIHGSGQPMIWKAAADLDFVFEKKTVQIEFVLVKENSRWVIFGYETLPREG